MRSKTRRARKLELYEGYEYCKDLQYHHDMFVAKMEMEKNMQKYGYYGTDKERYGIKNLYNSLIQEDEGGKFILEDEDGNILLKRIEFSDAYI